MQPNLFPFGSIIANPFLSNGDLNEGLDSSRFLFLVPFLLFQGGGMDLSKVGEKILSSVLSARSLGLIPSVSDRPEVPARAAAAAAAARAIAGLPPHQRYSISSSSEELSSIYGRIPHTEVVEEVEDEFYEEDFDPVRHILERAPCEENELAYFEKQAALRLAQLDRVAEYLSRQVMEHHQVMVKGMNLVRELEKDLKIANVICMNGRRHLTSSMNEVSRDLIVNSNSKKKQALLDMLAILNELRHALEMQSALESFVEEDNYCKAFQVLPEYLQLLDCFSKLSVMQEMGRSVEVWLGRTLQKLDALLLSVCQEFKAEGYITVIDAYALIGDASGLAEKIQSFFMQEVISETHSVLKIIVQEEEGVNMHTSRFTYSDLCLQITEPKCRQCLLRTLSVLFKLMCSYQEIMDFQVHEEGSRVPTLHMNCNDVTSSYSDDNRLPSSSCRDESANAFHPIDGPVHDETAVLSSESPWYHLRREATAVVSQTLQRGRKNLWQLTTSRLSVLLSSAAACSTSIHQFLKNYEDLNVFILAGEAFCGAEAVELRQKLKVVCENYFVTFHRQNIHALKMVFEKETWMQLPPDTVQMVSFVGLVGDGAPLITRGNSTNSRNVHLKPPSSFHTCEKNGFLHWLKGGNPFSPKVVGTNEVLLISPLKGASRGYFDGNVSDSIYGSPRNTEPNGTKDMSDDENEDLLADFIDEDSQLPSRISKLNVVRKGSLHCNNEEMMAQTGSSLCVLRSMDKYARLMQKLEIVNVEFFKGICQLFELFVHFVYRTFVQQNNTSGKGSNDTLNHRLRTALSRISQDCDQWIKTESSSPTSLSTFSHGEVTPTGPIGYSPGVSLKERCSAADTVNLVARILLRSKAHLLSMLLKSNTSLVEDFYTHLVEAVPDLVEHIHRTTAELLLHINGYADRIANTKWEVKELGLEHNGYVDLLLGEFKHYKTRLAHGGICKETQDLLLEYGVEIVAQTLVEGLSRVKKCTDEGRALMSLDLQVLINGLQHFVPVNVKPKLQMVETFIKAYYLPETEYVHWARAHPEYNKDQIIGLINVVATMKGWKRKTRVEVIEKIE